MKKKANKKNMKICLVGSSGGHLTHLYMLKPFWKDEDRFWVTFDKEDARSVLEGEKMYPCYYPTNRSLKALIKNTKIAWKVLRKEKPDVIISSGAAVAVPFFYLGKLFGSKLVYIEVFDRIDNCADLSCVNYLKCFPDGVEKIQKRNTQEILYGDEIIKSFFSSNVLCNNTIDKLFKLSIVEQIKFPEGYAIGEYYFDNLFF